MKKFKKRFLQILLLLTLLYIALLVPDSKSSDPVIKANEKLFVWNKDSLWLQLENKFRQAKQIQPAQLDSTIQSLKIIAEADFSIIAQKNISATDSNLIKIENHFFDAAPFIAVQSSELSWYIDYYNRVRIYIKQQSQHWNTKDIAARNTVYTLLYGMRAAEEEVFLQSDSMKFAPAMLGKNEHSVTPAAKIFGIEVHSGDLLVSRGGAEVSALISRGNDYPGNFSHVALLYVEAKTKKPYLIEAHIEKVWRFLPLNNTKPIKN